MDKIRCRICSGDLYTVLDLGELYISDFLTDSQEGEKAPLSLGQCKRCGLTQLEYDVNIDSLYKEHYWYRSSLNKSMLRDLEDIVLDIESRITLNDRDIVVDIGTNDGSLFNYYTNKNLIKVGFDPAPNLRDAAKSNCDIFINNYFSQHEWYNHGNYYMTRNHQKAKVITSIAMFYDLPDPNKFVKDIKEVLDSSGMWVIQFTDLLSMIKVNAIDNICAEHLEYYRLRDIVKLMNVHGLEVFDVSYNKVNGGSIRIFVSYPGVFKKSKAVSKAYKAEGRYLRYDNLQFLQVRINLFRKFINNYLSKFNSVYGMAASTKGSTLLQLLELDNKVIKAIGEINEDKFGLRTAGTNIPIIPETEVLEANPDVIIVLAWHFEETFNEVLKEYIRQGGRVLYPLPIPKICTNEGDFYLNG